MAGNKKLSDRIDITNEKLAKLTVKRQTLLNEALAGTDQAAIIKAATTLKSIEKREETERKTILVDVADFQTSFDYKDRNISMSYDALEKMAATPIINSIIKTRLTQVAAFAEPVKDEYSIGYKIQKRRLPGIELNDKLTKSEEQEIYNITEFIENTGMNEWTNDDFDTFVRKYIKDSLTFDQGTFEIVRDKRGIPVEFFATDAKTMRVARSYDDAQYEMAFNRKRKAIMNYYPSHVQVIENKVAAEYYPWELSFGIRNPHTRIKNQGYGVSELEELVTVVTSLLHGYQYNANFFKQGSAPKGFFNVKGKGFNDTHIQNFKRQWRTMVSGVSNAWKTPFLNADQVEWVDLQKGNSEMGYSNWIEFLIKISCAIYTIDPAEVNFPLQGGANSKPMFEGSNEARIKHSKDKGLYPLLKFLQKKLNKQIVKHFYNGKYEFVFTGLDSVTRKEQAELDEKSVKTYKTVNELRAEKGMDKIEGGDIILDSSYIQKLNGDEQNKLMSQEQQGVQYPEMPMEENEEDNPIQKAFFNYIDNLN